MEELLQQAREVAIEAAVRAGQIAKERFDGTFVVTEKGEHGDLVTEVDELAEREILRLLQNNFPEHQIRSEETGWSGVEGDWLWLVDPLDGTNNFAVGLPVYGVSITLLHHKRPVLGVIYNSHLEKLYVAERGQGSTLNGNLFSMPSKQREAHKLTVGWIQGHNVQKHGEAMQLKHHLDLTSKRVLRLWAPTVQWSMLAQGELDGIVLYNSEGDDLYAGVLLALEAGAIVIDFDGNPFDRMNTEPYLIACHPEQRETFLQIVRQGLGG